MANGTYITYRNGIAMVAIIVSLSIFAIGAVLAKVNVVASTADEAENVGIVNGTNIMAIQEDINELKFGQRKILEAINKIR